MKYVKRQSISSGSTPGSVGGPGSLHCPLGPDPCSCSALPLIRRYRSTPNAAPDACILHPVHLGNPDWLSAKCRADQMHELLHSATVR